MKIEKHQPTDDFLNTMSSFCFQPQILQPTRITDHSATLIDNTFFNLLQHFKISGNVIYDISNHLPLNFLIFDYLNFHLYQTMSSYIKEIVRISIHNIYYPVSEFQLIDWHSVAMLQICLAPSNNKISAIIDKHISSKASF